MAEKLDEIQTVAARQKTLADLLEKYKAAMAKAAPKWFNVERALMVARLAYSRSPQLLKCTPLSIVACAAYATQLGLELAGAGGVHPVPFWNRRRGVLEAQPITDYRGLIALAMRSGRISSVEAHIVYKNDVFKYAFGTKKFLTHQPTDGERGDMTHAYAIARLKDGEHVFTVWPKDKVEAHRDRFSKAATEGPWMTDFEAMALKTTARDLCGKWLPMAADVQQVIEREERAEAGEPEDLTGLLGLEELPEDHGKEDSEPTGKLGNLTDKLETAQKERSEGVGSQGSPERIAVEEPPAQTGERGHVKPVDPPVEGARQPVGDNPLDERETVLAAIASLMRELRVNSNEQAFLWEKYGGSGGHPASGEQLLRLRDHLEGIKAKMGKTKQRQSPLGTQP